MNPQLINFVLFQIGWFSCVLGAANNLTTVGLVVGMFVILVHLIVSQYKLKETAILISVTLAGYAWDSLLVKIGVFAYRGTSFLSIAPIWIAVMWAMFATTLNSSLRWLQRRYLLAILLGAIFGPLAYLSASKLGAVTALIEPAAWLLQAVAWGVLMPLMFLISKLIYRK